MPAPLTASYRQITLSEFLAFHGSSAVMQQRRLLSGHLHTGRPLLACAEEQLELPQRKEIFYLTFWFFSKYRSARSADVPTVPRRVL